MREAVIVRLERSGSHTSTKAQSGSISMKADLVSSSADQEIGPKTDGCKQGDAEHRLFMPAHALLGLTDCQGAHD